MSTYVGLDLGREQDYSALAVVQAEDVPPPPAPLPPDADALPVRVPHLERYPLRTPYTAIVARVAALLALPELAGARLVIDATGVGAAVVDMFDAAGVRHERVTITGGAAVTREGRDWHVPKRDLVAAVRVLLEARRLRVAAGLALAGTLERELSTFQYSISAATAHDSYGAWREGQHDDLLLAVALACWRATRPSPRLKVY